MYIQLHVYTRSIHYTVRKNITNGNNFQGSVIAVCIMIYFCID